MEASAPVVEPAWGVDSEYGQLLDVLLCPPDTFRWLPTSVISRATLDSGLVFSREDALRQHAEMVSVYEQAGVRVHFLEDDPALPYQVFARDSSINVPDGPIVTQCAQWWRRGEYAPVIRFYGAQGIPIKNMAPTGFDTWIQVLTFVSVGLVAVYTRGMVQRLLILVGLIVASVIYALLTNGMGLGKPIDFGPLARAAWFGAPQFTAPGRK